MYDKKAMLVELTIRQWTARKHDRNVSHEVDQNHAAVNGGQYQKQLVAKKSLEAINSKASAIRAYHYRMTLPWGNNGQHLLPAKVFMEYRNTIVKMRNEFDQLVDTFIADYPAEVEAARNYLGTLFNPLEYPAASDIRHSFGVTFDISPVPTSGDFRVDIATEQRDEIQAQITALNEQRQNQATKACYERVRETLGRMKTQCVPGKTRITESLTDSVSDLVDSLKFLNITDDPALEQLRQDIARDLTVDAKTLRTDAATREATGVRAAELLESLPWS